ncbi:deoxynucleoside monophosphate kinase [Paraglaciecola Antarctic GD virus 1]|nr:deoxynucleoside monophosphate kinase [Paraglaciecola Antarctic GD virus 1]
MKILCICGKKRSGKDQVADMIKSIKPSMSYALAYPVKVGLTAGFAGIKHKGTILDYDAFDGTHPDIDREEILDIEFKQIVQSLSIGFRVLGRDLQDELGGKVVSETMRQLSVQYNEAGGFSIRNLMQIFGTDIGCNLLGNDIWLVYCLEVWLKALQSGKYENFIVTDVRQSHEIQMFRSMGANITHLDRSCINSIDQHITEIGIVPFDNEVIIKNHGSLDELYEKIKQLIG